MHELIELEEQGWQALSSPGSAGRDFYRSVLREDAVMLFPGGMLISGKTNILECFGAQPWQSHEIEELKVIPLGEGAAVLVYRVSAQRSGCAPYVALIGSTYALSEGSWKLVVHQQTPV